MQNGHLTESCEVAVLWGGLLTNRAFAERPLSKWIKRLVRHYKRLRADLSCDLKAHKVGTAR